jgi:zinc protease
MFRGTKKYPGNVYDSLITIMGANANAYTTDDYTCYHLNIAAEDLEMIMELESDRFQNLYYEEQEFQTESQAVYGEYRKGKTSPWMWIWEKLKETAFDKHTYKHTTIGFESDIKAMPTMYEYSKNFFKRYYRPENVVLLIAGDIQKDNIMELVNKYYSNWQTGYQSPKIEAEPPQKNERIAEVKYPGKSLPILSVAFKGGAFNPEDKTVMSAILLGDLAFGENSPLYKKLYLQEQKVQALEPEFNYNRDPFLWIVWAEIKEDRDINYIKNEIIKTIETYKNQPPDKTQLENLKKRTKYSFLMSLETPNNVAANIARIIAITGGIEAVDKTFKTIESISPEDIQAAANHYFRNENRTVVALKGTK